MPWLIAAIAVAGSLFALRRGGEPIAVQPAPALRAVVNPPSDSTFGESNGTAELALSPDGSRIAFRARQGDVASLWVQTLATGEAAPIVHTTNAEQPFFSPDGRQLGFCGSNRTLRAIDLVGRSELTLVDGETCWGGTWAGPDTILYASQGAVRVVPASGGAASVVLPRGRREPAFTVATSTVMISNSWCRRPRPLEEDNARELVWVSRAGARLGRIGAPGQHGPGIWVHDLARASDTRLSSQIDGMPVWSPDGTRLAFERGWTKLASGRRTAPATRSSFGVLARGRATGPVTGAIWPTPSTSATSLACGS